MLGSIKEFINGNEGIVYVGAAIVAVIVIIFIILRLVERSHIRKTSIFRVKKNKYKSRLGKKNIKY